MKLWILPLLFLTALPHLPAQENRLSELLQQLDTASTDSARVYLNKQLGYYYQNLNQDKALTYFENGMEAAMRSEDSLQMANIHFSMGYTLGVKDDLPGAMDHYLKALRIYEALDDPWRLVNTYMSISNLYLKNDDIEKQQEYLDQAEAYLIREQDSVQLSELYNHKGVIYDQQNKLDSALVFLEKALRIATDTGDPGAIGSSLINLGLTLKHMGRTSEALDRFMEALPIYDSREDYFGLTILYNNLGSTYLQGGRYREAEKAFFSSLTYAEKAGMDQGLLENYKNLAELFGQKEDYRRQSEYLEKYYSLKDSLFTIDKENQLTQLESDYVIEKKNLELATRESELEKERAQNITYIALLAFSLILAVLLLVYYTRSRKRNQLLVSKNELIGTQKKTLEKTLSDLKSTQAQLIHAEKMASLGELTAGIAHEIQNPLNFVNNFSEVSRELVEEMQEEIKNQDFEEVTTIAEDLKQNLEKINHHGNRAGNIVRGMLQHSRASDGKKEPTDLGALADEYLRLAYHGLRAKDKSFTCTLETDFDPDLPEVDVVPQDIGRVLLNLITNAFHAVSEQKQKEGEGYEPTVRVATKKLKNGVEISVRDNGGGIPDAIKDKIFQPFFTTKPTGEGTGLGLSMSYDIVTKGHNGSLEVASEEGKGTTLTVKLPI